MSGECLTPSMILPSISTTIFYRFNQTITSRCSEYSRFCGVHQTHNVNILAVKPVRWMDGTSTNKPTNQMLGYVTHHNTVRVVTVVFVCLKKNIREHCDLILSLIVCPVHMVVLSSHQYPAFNFTQKLNRKFNQIYFRLSQRVSEFHHGYRRSILACLREHSACCPKSRHSQRSCGIPEVKSCTMRALFSRLTHD